MPEIGTGVASVVRRESEGRAGHGFAETPGGAPSNRTHALDAWGYRGSLTCDFSSLPRGAKTFLGGLRLLLECRLSPRHQAIAGRKRGAIPWTGGSPGMRYVNLPFFKPPEREGAARPGNKTSRRDGLNTPWKWVFPSPIYITARQGKEKELRSFPDNLALTMTPGFFSSESVDEEIDDQAGHGHSDHQDREFNPELPDIPEQSEGSRHGDRQQRTTPAIPVPCGTDKIKQPTLSSARTGGRRFTFRDGLGTPEGVAPMPEMYQMRY